MSAESVLTPEVRDLLSTVSASTAAGLLQRKGIRSTFLAGLLPLNEGQRMLGIARTLRYIPVREDIAPKLMSPSMQKVAVESLQPGEVLVIDGRNETGGATIGDLFVMRARALGAVGVVTDGCLRDTTAVRDVGLPVYNRASNGATFQRVHMPLEQQVPIACAGVTVMPGDVMLGDAEGVVVIPAALVAEIAEEGAAAELQDMWSAERLAAGESTEGVFPISNERRPEFEAWLAQRTAAGTK